MGEFDMYRQAGTTPNFTDIARRYGMNRHTVAKYWKAGGQVEDARRCRPSGLDRHREVIEAKAQLPGATKRGIYEYLIDRCYAGEEPPAYNMLTKWMRRNGIECGRPPEGPEPHPRFETAARRADAVRLEGVAAHGRRRGRGVRVQRVLGHAGLHPGSTGSSTPGRAPRTTSWRACWR